MASSVLFEDDVKKMEEYLAIHPENINILQNGQTPLMNAVLLGRTDVVDILIGFGANVNLQDKIGYTVLHRCCKYQSNNRDILRRLLEANADPMCINYWGDTPVHLAAEKTNDVNVIHDLTLGSNPNFQNKYGHNALMMACQSNKNPEVISACINITNDLNTTSMDGNTGLHLACAGNNYNAIPLLLEAGVDMYITNNRNKIAYEFVSAKGKEIFNEFANRK